MSALLLLNIIIWGTVIAFLVYLYLRPRPPPPKPPTYPIDVGGGSMFRAPPTADTSSFISGVAVGMALQSAISTPRSPSSE